MMLGVRREIVHDCPEGLFSAVENVFSRLAHPPQVSPPAMVVVVVLAVARAVAVPVVQVVIGHVAQIDLLWSGILPAR